MGIDDFLHFMGRQKAPHNADPLSGYIRYITNYIGDEDLVTFCFDLMLQQVDFEKAEYSPWSAVCPDFSFIQFKDYRNNDVRILLKGKMKLLFQQMHANKRSGLLFEYQARLVYKIAAVILSATGLDAYGLTPSSDFHRGHSDEHMPGLNQTRLCFEPWMGDSVALDGQVAPCSQIPGIWNFEDSDQSLFDSIGYWQQSLLNGDLNCFCKECKVKPLTTVEHLRYEVEKQQLRKVNAIIFSDFSKFFNSSFEAPIAPTHLRHRISGISEPMSFVFGGIQLASKMMFYIEKYDHSEAPHLLDWGCGCGRYAYNIIKNYPDVQYTGCDIDREAIAWCSNNISGGDFVVNNLYPPTPFANEQFSSVIASSVMTHLDRKNQLVWLKEIYRILKPGGVFVASVHGLAAAKRTPGLEKKTKKEGIYDTGADTALDGIAPKDYYRAVFQTEQYIRTHWSQLFEIKEYIHAGIMDFQDLVVLQKKEAHKIHTPKKNWLERVFQE